MALTSQELPVPDFYAAGADKLNIEFGKVNKYTRFSVWANDTMLFAQPIGQRVYTINYDYATPLTVVVTDGLHSKDYVVDPEPLRRNVLTFNTDYYWITGLGVQSGKSGLLAGHFLHLFAGQGLTATGKLVDLAEGEVIKEKVEIGLCEEAQPLHSFTYEADYRIKTYKNFSEITHDGETVTRDLQLLVKNGRLAALDPLLPVVYDGVIVDTVGEAEYLTVLGTDGKLADLKEPIVLPKDFKNYNLVQMSHNLRSSSPYVLVRYQNGSVVAFNYLTGELLSVETVKSDLSLIEYAKEFLQSKMDSVLADLSDGYLQISKLKEKLLVSPSPDELIHGEKINGEKAESTEELSANNEDKALEESEEAEETDEAEEIEETEEAEQTEETEENEIIEEAEESGGAGKARETGEIRETGETQSQPVGAKNTGGKSSTSVSTEAINGDLPQSKPQVRQYIPIYDAKTGQYLLYEEKNLLEAADTQLTPVNKPSKITAVFVEVPQKAHKMKHTLEENKGILLLFLIGISIIVLLLYIHKKRRL